MTYDNALNLIIQKQSLGIKPGLSRICELLNKMGNPQEKLNIIHIAGTNGKGTVACAIAGAMHGASVFPEEMCKTVVSVNKMDIPAVAKAFTEVFYG